MAVICETLTSTLTLDHALPLYSIIDVSKNINAMKTFFLYYSSNCYNCVHPVPQLYAIGI